MGLKSGDNHDNERVSLSIQLKQQSCKEFEMAARYSCEVFLNLLDQ